MEFSPRLQLHGRSDSYESEPEFRDLIGRLSGSGIFYAGLFAVMLTLVHLAVHRVALGFELSWTYRVGEHPRAYVALWDKSVIILLGVVAMATAHTSVMARWGRLLASLLVLIICTAILADDILNGDVNFTSAYFALVLLVAVNTIPFKPSQTFALGVAAIILMTLGKLYLPALLGVTGVAVGKTQMLYMALVVVVLTGITSLLYRYRYEQFSARRSAEALNRALEQRTHALESEKKRTDEQAERLAAMEDLKARFFSNITHQFRTPLTLILGPAQDALDERFGPLDAGVRTQFDLIQRNGLRLQHLIDQLLDLARLDAGGVKLDLQTQDLHAFLEGLHQAFVPLAERKSIDLQYSADCSSLWTPFDSDNLEKALSNLLSNAIKFTPAAGKVRLTLHAGAEIEIRVRDSGPGIPDDELEHIFDRFHQARGIAGDAAGSGIGLALAKELIELHGGTIRAESEVGFGTHLVVKLPYAVSSRLEGVPTVDPEPESIGDGIAVDESLLIPSLHVQRDTPTVLIIDDNNDVRTYLRGHLEPRYEVIEAIGGCVGIELARKHHPALIICDVMMPTVDGLQVCRTLKEGSATRDIPIILLTARATEEAKIEGLAARADDYMFKPFSATELLTRVENLIELRRVLWQAAKTPAVMTPAPPNVPSGDQKFLEGVQAAIELHMSNTNFGVEWLADEVALSARQLQRRLQATVGLSAAGLIRMMRLQRAAQLLEGRAAGVSEIAYMVGFQDAGYFTRLFKQTFGLTPTEYAERQSAPMGTPGVAEPKAEG